MKKTLQEQYERKERRKQILLWTGMVGVIFLAFGTAVLGASDTSVRDLFAAIGEAVKTGGNPEDTGHKVIFLLRLPRIVMAVFAGIGLSVAGTAMQGITGNPLVSPFTLGISNAAAFGASLSLVFGIGIGAGTEGGVVFQAFLWAGVCTVLVYLVSSRAGLGPESMILAGIGLNYLFSAATSVIQYFADEHKLTAAVQWAFGSLNGAAWEQTVIVAALVTICSVALFFMALDLNAMAAGDDEVAISLGVHPERVRILAGILAVLMTAAVISFTGVIGFVGLAGPHMARLMIGNDHRYLLPCSGLWGAALLLAADAVGRMLLAPVVIPVGIVVSFIGVPVFINLVLTAGKGGNGWDWK